MTESEIVYTKEFVYFLGFLWSDGYIERKRTLLEIVEEDAQNIVDDIRKISFLNICTMKRSRENRKPQMTIYFCNRTFYDIFQSKYFDNKSFMSPLKLIDDIPENLIRYFYIGLFDGDGCFYFNKTTRQFYVTSSYKQDWSHVENLFKLLGINQYEIRKIINKNGNKSSYIRIKKHNEIVKLYEYLYPQGLEIGLSRKYLKCKEIIDNPPKYNSNKMEINTEDLVDKIQNIGNIYQISDILNCNWRKIHDFCKKNNIKKPNGFYSKKKKY